MPRPRKPGAPEPKRRSRKGCWPCKARKVKCGEEKPSCVNCLGQGETCDYSIRLNWEGRTKKASTSQLTSSRSGYTAEILLSQGPGRGAARVGPLPCVQPQTSACGPSSVQGCSTSEDVLWDASGRLDSAPAPPAVFEDRSISCNDSNEDASTVAADLNGGVPASFRLAESPRAALPPCQSFPSPPSRQSPYLPSSDTNIPNSNAGSIFALNFNSQFAFRRTSFLRQSLETQSQRRTPSLEDNWSPDRVAKHTKSPQYPCISDAFSHRAHNASHAESPGRASDMPSAHISNVYMPPHLRRHFPLSPADSANSDDTNAKVLTPLSDSPNLRRVSINSLLSTENGKPDPVADSPTAGSKQSPWLASGTVDYGLDCGRPDFDLNRNDDIAAIQSISCSEQINPHWNTDLELTCSEAKSNSEKGVVRNDYYAKPVRVKIPKSLTPLPSTLLENPINLMYFHHFFDHTARIMVPHDCLENPFLSVMPSMVVEDPNLLNLLLAYSASHRARYLRHPEPASRIAHWVSDVFPALRHALHDPRENITDSHLATSIMLLSLKIISPSTFEVPIPWQSHLKLARDLFLARGGRHLAHPGNRIAFFLARWLAYIDIFGALSCPHSDPPLFEGRYWSVTQPGSPLDEDEEFRVDCFTGLTLRTATQLARVAELTHRCDNERFDELGNFCTGWSPTPDTVLAAEALLRDMNDSRRRGYTSGTHHTEQENCETIAVDQAFHWSGVLHLHRRVLGTPPSAPEVQEALSELMSALARVRPGSFAEICVLFPLFTAGCEAQDPQQRLEIMERVKSFEGVGLKQIQNARQLMQRCWAEGLPWIALARGEFLA